MISEKPPTHLGAQGRKLWAAIAAKYDLRPDEIRILIDVCREADLIERLEVLLRDSDLMVRGSQGQLVASPLVSELRQHRATLTTMLKALHLPESESTTARLKQETSEKARKAIKARWDRVQTG